MIDRALAVIVATVAAMLATAATAETVDVKFVGPVDLAGYECAEPESSLVHRICYQAADKHVVVLLQRTYYAYCGVDAGTVAEWLSAESKGRFYNQRIKSDVVDGKFACRD